MTEGTRPGQSEGLSKPLVSVGVALDAGNAVRQQMGAIPSEEDAQPGKSMLLLGVFGAAAFASKRKKPSREQLRKLADLLDGFAAPLAEAAHLTGDAELLQCLEALDGSGPAVWENEKKVSDLRPLVNRATSRLLKLQTQLFLGRE